MSWATCGDFDSPALRREYDLPVYRKVRVRLLRPLCFGGQRKEAGEVVKVIEPDALSLVGLKRAELIVWSGGHSHRRR